MSIEKDRKGRESFLLHGSQKGGPLSLQNQRSAVKTTGSKVHTSFHSCWHGNLFTCFFWLLEVPSEESITCLQAHSARLFTSRCWIIPIFIVGSQISVHNSETESSKSSSDHMEKMFSRVGATSCSSITKWDLYRVALLLQDVKDSMNED